MPLTCLTQSKIIVQRWLRLGWTNLTKQINYTAEEKAAFHDKKQKEKQPKQKEDEKKKQKAKLKCTFPG